MAINHVESSESYKAKMNAARTLGVDAFWLGMVLKEYPRKADGVYAMPESNQRAEIAREVYKKHESEIEVMLELYEANLSRMQKGKARVTGPVRPGRECRVCGKDNPSLFEACPVCLDVYLQEFRDDFLGHMSTCKALEILDS